MEELEALDKKALEQQYVCSYKYSRGQKLMAIIIVITAVIVMIFAGTFIFSIIINGIMK